jgi:hypothetical protein
MKTNDITKKVIGCAYTVGNTLGAGFLGKVYCILSPRLLGEG